MRLTRCTHACVRIEVDGVVLALDPGEFGTIPDLPVVGPQALADAAGVHVRVVDGGRAQPRRPVPDRGAGPLGRGSVRDGEEATSPLTTLRPTGPSGGRRRPQRLPSRQAGGAVSCARPKQSPLCGAGRAAGTPPRRAVMAHRCARLRHLGSLHG